MSDDYSAPLGLDRVRSRPRRRLWPFGAALILAGIAFLAGWAAIHRDPGGGEPGGTLALPALPPKPAVAPAAAEAPAEPPDDPGGQIIIRDP